MSKTNKINKRFNPKRAAKAKREELKDLERKSMPKSVQEQHQKQSYPIYKKETDPIYKKETDPIYKKETDPIYKKESVKNIKEQQQKESCASCESKQGSWSSNPKQMSTQNQKEGAHMSKEQKKDDYLKKNAPKPMKEQQQKERKEDIYGKKEKREDLAKREDLGKREEHKKKR